MTTADVVERFVRASVRGPLLEAVQLLAADPGIATYDVRTAVILGDAQTVREALANDPDFVARPDDETGWPPLLGVCSSRWHKDPARAEGLLEIATMLLDAGADPNTRVDGERYHCGTLYAAAGCSNNPSLTRLLLERGAVPDDHTVYLSAFCDDHACLRLLLPHVPDIATSTALAAPISTNNLDGVRLLLDAGVDPNRVLPDETRSPYRNAIREGRVDLAELLAAAGARDDTTAEDRLLFACLTGDRVAARQLAGQARLTEEDQGTALVAAADKGDVAAVTMMLDLGFDIDARGGHHGATALHAAAGSGSVELVRLLVERGADIEIPDRTWQSSPLDWAAVGSGMHLGENPHPDWVATVRTLIAAGARPVEWGGDKPPSDDVAAILAGHR